jgi:probable rRNA maturation factor
MSVKPLKRSTAETFCGTAGLTLQRFNDSTIAIASRQRARKINRRLLKQIAMALLADLKIEKAELGIHLVATPEMTRLNERFLGHAGSTDVITFDYRFGVPPSGGPPKNSRGPNRLKPELQTMHGDILVCVDEAVCQARKFGACWQSEVVRYIVHGVLHLLGFDDSSAGARRKMRRQENRRLRELASRFALSKL